MEFPIMFYGHEIFPSGLWIDVILALLAIPCLQWYLNAQKLGNKKAMFLSGYLFILHLPNSVYLFAEFKHIIMVNDGIADGLEAIAVITFGILSLLGMVTTVSQVYLATTKVDILRKNHKLSAVLLCFMAAWGCVLGFNGLTTLSRALFFPPLIIVATFEALTLKWILVTMALGSFLSILSLLTCKVLKPESKQFT